MMLARKFGLVALLSSGVLSFGLMLTACGDDAATDTNTSTPGGSAGKSSGSGGSGTGGTTSGTGGTSSGTGGTSSGTGGSSTGGSSTGGMSMGTGGSDPGMGGGAGMSTSTGDCVDGPTCEPLFGCAAKGGCKDAPPVPADAVPGDGATATVHAVRYLWLGESPADDDSYTADPDAWKKFGYDLDKWYSAKGQDFHCQVYEGGKKSDIREDGEGGIDNSFGRNIIPILTGFIASPSQTVNETIADGSFTLLLKVNNLGAGASQKDLKAELYAGEGTVDGGGNNVPVTAENWANGDYVWHPFAELLEPDGTSKVKFPTAYLANNTFVSGSKSTVNLTLAISGYNLGLEINQAQLEVAYAADRKTGKGNLGGILETEKLLGDLQKIAGRLSSSLCEEATFKGIADQIRQASDIMKDGTQDVSQTCNGISIGLGLTAAGGTIGDAAPAAEPSADPCAK